MVTPYHDKFSQAFISIINHIYFSFSFLAQEVNNKCVLKMNNVTMFEYPRINSTDYSSTATKDHHERIIKAMKSNSVSVEVTD